MTRRLPPTLLDPRHGIRHFTGRGRSSRIPLVLIGGFLGAGKSTLLNSILRQADQQRLAVLVNDFGAINIDSQMIERVEAEQIDLSNGCVCCTIRDDLVAAIERLARAQPAPEYILIETSGISDPQNIIATCGLSNALVERVFFDSVVTVVDCAHALDVLEGEHAALFERQVAAAYLVILNKSKQISAAQLVQVRTTVGKFAPDASILQAECGEIALPLLLDSRPSDLTFRPPPIRKDVNHGFQSLAWRSGEPLDRKRFEAMLESMRNTIFRAKGLLHFSGSDCVTQFQKVGRVHEFLKGAPWGGVCPSSQLVLIGSRDALDDEQLHAMLEACRA